MYIIAIFTPCILLLYLLNYSSDESEAEGETENDDSGNIIKLTFVDETNIPNIGIGEPNIVIDTNRSANSSENNVNDIKNGHTSKKTVFAKTYRETVKVKKVLLHQLLD